MKNFWDRSARIYDWKEALNRRAFSAMLAETKRLTPPGALALDCACGTGALSFAMAEKAAQVLCTDLSEAMLAQAQRKARRKNIQNVAFARRDICALPDANDTYDITAAGNVLHLLEQPERAVAELQRVTRPGGRILLPTYLTKNKAKTMVGLYRLLGFRPVQELDRDGYLTMLERCGARIDSFVVLPGRIPVGMAVLKVP